MSDMQQTIPNWTKPTDGRPPFQAAVTAVSSVTRQAGESVRRHQQEMLILGGTLLFVLVVALLSLPAVL